jgi:type I restriction enzyme R subunit
LPATIAVAACAERRAWLEASVPEAQKILEDPLAKYAEHRVGQLDDLRVLEVYPISRHGTPVEIAERFGGPEGLRGVLSALEQRLYAA